MNSYGFEVAKYVLPTFVCFLIFIFTIRVYFCFDHFYFGAICGFLSVTIVLVAKSLCRSVCVRAQEIQKRLSCLFWEAIQAARICLPLLDFTQQ